MPNPNGHVATLQPAWASGTAPKAGRRSRDVDRALRMARKLSPDGIAYCGSVLNDPEEHVRYRLKAAEIILAAGLPKGADAITRFLGDDDAALLRIEFVDTAGDAATVTIERSATKTKAIVNGHDAGDGTFSVSFGDDDDPP